MDMRNREGRSRGAREGVRQIEESRIRAASIRAILFRTAYFYEVIK
jgi:hypothetical protein